MFPLPALRGSTPLALPTISPNGTSTLTLTLVNRNATAINPVNLTDALPSGMTIASTPNATNTCGGTLTATAGSGSVQLSGGILAAAPSTGSSIVSCTITVNVTASNTTTSNIVLTNSIPAGNWNGVGYLATSAGLTVIPGGRVLKSFLPTTISTGGTSTLTIELDNFTAAANSPINLTDTLPTGVTVAPTPNVTNTCGGTVTAAAGASSVQLSGGSLPAGTGQTTNNGVCKITVSVTAANTGSYTNTIPSGTSWNGVSYVGSSAILTVTTPFTASKFINANFNIPTVSAGSVYVSGVTLTNNTASPITVTVTLALVLPGANVTTPVVGE